MMVSQLNLACPLKNMCCYVFPENETCSCNCIILPKKQYLIISVIFRVYGADHTYCTLRFPMCTTSEVIKVCAAEKLQINRKPEEMQLLEIRSNGEKFIFKDHDVGVPTSLSLNGRIFVALKEQIDALV